MVSRNYYDLHVTTNHSFGTTTVEEIIRMAERLGLHTIAIIDAVDTKAELDKIKQEIAAVRTSLQVLLGIELRAESDAELNDKVNKFRDLVDVIAVSGGNLEINKAACENPKVNLLAHPEFKRKDSGLDHVMIKEAAQNGVAIELNFREYLHTTRKLRSHVLAHMRNNVMLAQHLGAPVIVTSAAESVWDMRAGRELATLAYLCGMDREQAVNAVSTVPDQIVARVRQIRTPGYVMPGVKERLEAH